MTHCITNGTVCYGNYNMRTNLDVLKMVRKYFVEQMMFQLLHEG